MYRGGIVLQNAQLQGEQDVLHLVLQDADVVARGVRMDVVLLLPMLAEARLHGDVSNHKLADLRVVNAASAFTHGGNYTYGGLDGNITFSVNMSDVSSDVAPSFQMSAGRHYIINSLLHANAGCGFVVKQGNSVGGFVSLMSDNNNFLGYIGVAQDKVYLTAETSGALLSRQFF